MSEWSYVPLDTQQVISEITCRFYSVSRESSILRVVPTVFSLYVQGTVTVLGLL